MSDHTANRNLTKQRIRKGELALGLITRIVRSGEIALIAKESGHDFLFIDSQHAAFDIQTVSTLAMTAAAVGLTPLVRVRAFDDPNIPLLLDAGAMGIIVPDVATAEEARKVVRVCRFPPEGERSFAGPAIGLGYSGVMPSEASRILNEGTLVVCMIETPGGLANASEIASVAGVDVLHVGCGDLLMAMGKPGDFACPEIAAAVRSVIKCCKKEGKVAGFGGDRDLARQRQYIEEGVRFVTTQVDVALLLSAASVRVAELRTE